MEYPEREIKFNYCECGHIDAWHVLSFDNFIKAFIHFLSGGQFRSYYNECRLCMCPKYTFKENRGIKPID